MMIKELISPIFSSILAIGAGVVLYFVKIKLVKQLGKKSKKNLTPVYFAINFAFGVALFVLLIPVLAEFGVPTASLVTILGTSSLAIGLALKGFLSNIAAGIMVILQKPFVVGDLIEAQGATGTVEKIDLFSVCLRTPSNELIYLQNNKLISDKITNKNKHQKRRIEISIDVGYDSDLKLSKEIITNYLNSDARVIKDPSPVVVTDKLDDSSIVILVRFWIMTKDLLQVKQDMLESILVSFDENDIVVPYPQLEVSLNK